MRKMLISFFALVAIVLNLQVSFAACHCTTSCAPYSACGCCCPYEPCECCEGWLDCKCLEDYFCRIGLNECQKCEARQAAEIFKCKTQCLRAKGCQCETKHECRCYRNALRDLDCKMKNIITRCQKPDYKCVRKEVKSKVKCCHKCLINPFKRCKCDCGCS